VDERLKLVECLGCDECEGMTENNVRDVTPSKTRRAYSERLWIQRKERRRDNRAWS